MQEEINFHYAFQSCDVANREINNRFCTDNRTLLSKKSFKSFIDSVVYCIEKVPNSNHTVEIFADKITEDLSQFYHQTIPKYLSDRLRISITFLKPEQSGIKNSIKQTYLWLQQHGKDFVYQVQDDYMFVDSCIFESYDTFRQIKNETGTDCVISPCNDSWLWLTSYRNRTTPRAVIVGKHRYWIQYYDMSCSFFTSHSQFSSHWDLYLGFFALIDQLVKDQKKDLENKSLNLILTTRNVLGLVPVSSLSFHMQSDIEKDPHIPWEPIWNSIDVS